MIRYSTVCITCVTTLKFVQKEQVNPIPMATLHIHSFCELENTDCVFACSDHGKPARPQTVMLWEWEWSMLNVFRSGRGQWVNQEHMCACADTVCNHYLVFSNDKSFQF